jgi:hypothetical protein
MRVSGTSESVAPYTPTAEQDPAPTPAKGQAAAPSAFGLLVQSLGRELDKGEALADRAIRGSTGGAHLSPEQLIALQAGIYRYSEAVDLVTKVVDRATQAVKTTLQNQ